jgi:hypothetical protein
MHVQIITGYRIEWVLPNDIVRYNEAEIYESMSAAIAASEQIKSETLERYARLTRRWIVCAEVRIVSVEIRRTVQDRPLTPDSL